MLFSVVLPTYNRRDVVQRALQSVLKQSFSDFEVLIIDDGSTDDTKDVLAGYVEKDARVKYHWQENSGKPAGSRNTGLKLAKGDWIAFLDSDDIWYPEKLQKMADLIQSYSGDSSRLAGAAHSARYVVAGEVRELRSVSKGMNSKPTFENLLYKGNFICTSAMLLKREVLETTGFFDERPDFNIVEDYDLWLKAAKIGEYLFLDEYMTDIIEEEDSISLQNEKQQDHLFCVMKSHIEQMSVSESKKAGLLAWAEARCNYFKGKNYLIKGNKGQAREKLWESMRLYPWDPKTWVFLLKAYKPI